MLSHSVQCVNVSWIVTRATRYATEKCTISIESRDLPAWNAWRVTGIRQKYYWNVERKHTNLKTFVPRVYECTQYSQEYNSMRWEVGKSALTLQKSEHPGFYARVLSAHVIVVESSETFVYWIRKALLVGTNQDKSEKSVGLINANNVNVSK